VPVRKIKQTRLSSAGSDAGTESPSRFQSSVSIRRGISMGESLFPCYLEGVFEVQRLMGEL
jgi:hypothetical protein